MFPKPPPVEQANAARYDLVARSIPLLFVLMLVLISCAETNQVDNSAGDWAFTSFVKVDSLNPILTPSPDLTFTCPISGDEVQWEVRNVLNPAAVVKDDIVYLFYRAQDSSGTSRIGLATSTDGLHFVKSLSPDQDAFPVLSPDKDVFQAYEWNYKKFETDTIYDPCSNCYFDGVEDPRIVVNEAGTYIMTYTAYDGRIARLSVATSTDLINWTKHGTAFKEDKYHDLWSKAGAIVAEQEGDQFVAKKIDGKYWMYFGDTNIFLATSDDLISWQICENAESQQKISVLHPRMGYFDSRLVEPGPFALYTEAGIVLIYNASNAANFNDPDLPKFTYAAGQALFDKDKPYQLIDRTPAYFIHPDKDYEKVGEVNEVCFVEGLVQLNGQWLLYYGTADSKIAVAVGPISE